MPIAGPAGRNVMSRGQDSAETANAQFKFCFPSFLFTLDAHPIRKLLAEVFPMHYLWIYGSCTMKSLGRTMASARGK